MAKMLTVDELVDCLSLMAPDEATVYRTILSAIARRMTATIKSHPTFDPAPELSPKEYLLENDLDQMIEDLAVTDPAKATLFKNVIEDIASRIAQRIARDMPNVRAGYASFQGVDLSGTCVPFFPTINDAPCPMPLCRYDVAEWDHAADPVSDEEHRKAAMAASVDVNTLSTVVDRRAAAGLQEIQTC